MIYKILFVCLGNICRSPSAQIIFENLLDKNNQLDACTVDSAGTHDFNIGHPPDTRAQAVALRHGLQMNHLRARQVTNHDFDTCDLILAMDHDNLHTLCAMAPAVMANKIQLLTRYASAFPPNQPIPDPYYGAPSDFDTMYDVLQDACQGLFEHLGEAEFHTVGKYHDC